MQDCKMILILIPIPSSSLLAASMKWNAWLSPAHLELPYAVMLGKVPGSIFVCFAALQIRVLAPDLGYF